MNQLKQDEVQEVIAVLPNGDKKILNRQVIQYHRDINWDKLLIDDRIQFTDWQVVPGTLDHWKALNYYIDDSDNVYYFGDPNTASKDNTIVFNAAIPGYKLELDKNDSIEEEKQVLDDENGPYKGNKPPKKFHDEYIHFYYTARKYKATFKFVNDKTGQDYPRYQHSLVTNAKTPPIEETYDEQIVIPEDYADYESTLKQKTFSNYHLKLSYIEYEGRHYQPEDLTKLKYTAIKDTEFIYHLVPDASVITYKDVTGLAEKDYDSKGKIITDSVMKNLNVNPNPQNGQWNYDKNGWNYKALNWTFVNAVSPDKINLTVYLKANDKSIKRVIKYVDGDGNEFLPSENTSMTVNHTVGDFVNTDNGLSPKYNGDLSGGNIFQIPSTKEKDNQKYYFDVNSKYFTTGAEKDKTPIADNGITVDKLANIITVKVPKIVESGTTYIFVLPYVQSHINVIYKDVTGLSNDQYASQAKNIEGHDKQYTGQPDMPFTIDKNDWDYKKDGWELASSDEIQFFPGADHKYSQDYVIYLKHGTEPVSKTVTETIEYQLADGTKLPGLTYENAVTLNGTKDKVTGDVIYDDQTLAAVTIPTKKGYTASVDNKPVNEIEKIKVDGNTADIIKTVTYTPNAQHAMVEYVDDTENKVIAQSPILSGVTDGKINYSTDQTIKSLEAEGYELVQNSDETKTDPMIFDNDDNIDQLFRVHFVHGTQNVNRQGKVTETIDYKFEDGKTAQPTVTQTKDFSENGVKDSVTGKITWTPATPQKFDDVVTPKITGYKPNKDNVDGTVVKFGDQDIVEHVVYSPDAQHAHLSFVDDTTGTKLLVKESADGHSDGGPISFTNGSTDLDNYVKKGYKFINITNDTAHVSLAGDSYNNAAKNFGNFDHNDDEDQNFTVHLVHDTVSVHRNHSANFIIHYVYKDGKQAKSDTKQTLNFTEDGLQDLVTNNITWTPAKSQKFTDVETPKITGYKPDQDKVTGPSANFKTGDSEVTVTYTPNAQHAMIEYIDDTENKVIAQSPILSGVTDGAINYSTKQTIKSLEAEGYKLVQKSDETKTNPMIFDNDDNSDQLFRVHFVHNIESVSDNNTVKEIVHYVYENGDEATDDKEQQVSFKRNGKLDHVTGKTVWDKADAQEFVEVDSPEIIGYTPSVSKVDRTTVHFGDKDIALTVIYKANNENAVITYVDDATGHNLKQNEASGKFKANIAFDINPQDQIKIYEKQGYKLVSNDFNNNVYHEGKNEFFVHLTHNTELATRTDSVSRTVKYLYENGKQAKPDSVQTIHFIENGITDNVTKNTKWNAAEPQKFNNIASPKLTGYTPDKENVLGETVNFGDKDIEVTVIYKADDQRIIVNYIDQDTGKTLQTKNLTGKTNADAQYNTQSVINSFEKKHYVLVSDDTNGKALKFDNDTTKDQTYNVYLKHDHKSLKDHSEVNETIHYIYSDNSKAAADYKANTIKFDRNGDQDLVTGEITWDAWMNTQSFASVKSPDIKGYTPNHLKVESKTVDHNSKDINIDVIYHANDQQAGIKYVDDTTGEVLGNDSSTGKFDQTITFGKNVNDQIKDYQNASYLLVSNNFNNQKFQSNNVENQFEVHLKHATKNMKRTNTVKEIIHYVFSNGSKVADDNIQNVNFEENGVQDLVTKAIEWKNAPTQSFNAVASPHVAGYTSDNENVAGKTVNFGDKDIEITVTYHANPQTAHFIFRDDDLKTDLEKQDMHGKTDENIDFTNAQNSFADYLLNRGFEFVSLSDETASRNNASDISDQILTTNKEEVKNYQNKFGNPYEQFFVIHLKHGVRDTKPGDKNKDGSDVVLTGEAKAIIHYVDEDGNKVADDSIQTIKFSRTGKTDAVTGQVIELNPWKADKPFTSITSPEISGYTANKDEVLPATPMSPEETAQEYTVVYTKNEQGLEEHHDGGDSGDDDQPDTPVDNPTSGDSDEFNDPSNWKEDQAEKDTYTEEYDNSRYVHKNKASKNVRKISKTVRGRDVIGKPTNEPIAAAVHNLGKKQTQAELPQTGEKQDKAGLIGLAFASIAGLLGLAGKRRKNK